MCIMGLGRKNNEVGTIWTKASSFERYTGGQLFLALLKWLSSQEK